ncbi:MAG: hypothetical protein PHU27_12555, partial [Salinivirgaceae bacterium]|nr:hypothetical protein [Salinivirgaceae bacterium]
MKSYFTSQFRLVALLIISLIASNSAAQNYYSQSSGDFNTLSNWNTIPTGGGSNPTSINATTGAFNVQTGHNIAVNDSVNIASLNVAGTLTFGNDATGRKLIVNGAVTVATNGSVGLSATTATHRMYVSGNIINNGTIDFRPAGSGRVVNVFMTATAAISGANEPIFNTLTVSSGTTTAQRSLYVKGNIVIQKGATFDAGTFTHTLSGNFTRLGTFNHNSGTFILNAPLVQIISTTLTSTTTFNNLTVNGGGILSISSLVTFDGSFLVTNNSKVNTNRDNIFKGSWEVQSGSEYKANNATALFSGSAVQNITIAGTVEFYRLYTQSSVKNITGELVVKNDFYIYSGSTIQDSLATQTHTFSGNIRIEGTVNFTHKVLLNSGGGISVWNSDDNSTISFGAADIEITGSVYIGNNDSNNTTLNVQGNFTITEGYLVIRKGSFLTGTAGKIFYQNENTNLYVRGTDNYPTGFATYTHEPTAWVRYDQNIDQTVRG